ncbi:MAG: L,D-transpeptidase family protein, partial [Alphaproteobacteria bacterium]|nr:L,D-transpeptidase family protein [Alphaproteobacteria bacterium]
ALPGSRRPSCAGSASHRGPGIPSGPSGARPGAGASRPTPLFSSALTWLEWNPTWTVPTSIAEKDYLPHLIEDPTYLSNKNMYVYAGWQPNAPVVDTQAVDWEEVGRGIRSFMLRQEPGPGNALGKVKFMMSNNFSVYLHDTPERYLFARTHRAYSSGCVRVQDPMWLADYLLAADPTWTGHESEPVMNHWRTTRMNMPSGMPLHVAYVTARLGEDGRPMFFEDIYGLDAAMADALAAHRPERTQIALAD